jgi:chromosomal replication initiator protein
VQSKQLWKLVLDDLQVSLSQGNYSTWIRPTELTNVTSVGEDRQIAEISCPSSFHQQMLETRYYAQIKEAVDKISKKNTELRLSINSSLKSGATRESAPLFTQNTQPTVTDFQIAQHRAGLNEELTFENFAVSSSNEMAHAAALAVSKNLGGAYNPLFLYGGVGVGKTHLMQAIANNVLKSIPTSPMVYCTGEEFTNDIIDAIQQKKTRAFKKKYRGAKGLYIDDIQFIAGKSTVQEEFFHTFNAIVKEGGQVVMTSDKSPTEINNLEDRLRSRFEGGLLIDIGEPNFELRTAILLIKAKQRKVNLPMDAAQAVAANVESTRRLEGFIVRLVSESKIRGEPISVEMVQAILNMKINPEPVKMNLIRPLELIRRVANYFHLTVKDIRGPKRARPIVVPRQISMFLLRKDMSLPLTEIGGLFGNRDHTTVMHAVDKISEELSGSESLRIDINNLRKGMQG